MTRHTGPDDRRGRNHAKLVAMKLPHRKQNRRIQNITVSTTAQHTTAPHCPARQRTAQNGTARQSNRTIDDSWAWTCSSPSPIALKPLKLVRRNCIRCSAHHAVLTHRVSLNLLLCACNCVCMHSARMTCMLEKHEAQLDGVLMCTLSTSFIGFRAPVSGSGM